MLPEFNLAAESASWLVFGITPVIKFSDGRYRLERSDLVRNLFIQEDNLALGHGSMLVAVFSGDPSKGVVFETGDSIADRVDRIRAFSMGMSSLVERCRLLTRGSVRFSCVHMHNAMKVLMRKGGEICGTSMPDVGDFIEDHLIQGDMVLSEKARYSMDLRTMAFLASNVVLWEDDFSATPLPILMGSREGIPGVGFTALIDITSNDDMLSSTTLELIKTLQ